MPVSHLEWHPELEDVLISIHVPLAFSPGSVGYMILWNTKDTTQIWKRPISDCAPVLSFQFSPFDSSVVSFATMNGCVYVPNFSVSDENNGVPIDPMFRVPGQQSSQNTQQSNAGANSRQNQNTLRSFSFSPHLRNLCFILMGREIIALDISTCKSIGTTSLDKIHESFHSFALMPNDPRYIVCCHTDTSVSVWKRRGVEFKFETCAFANIPHIQRYGAKKENLCSLALSPIDPTIITVVSPEGLLWMWKFNDTNKPVDDLLECAGEAACAEPVMSRSLSILRAKSRTGVLTVLGQTESIGSAICMAVRPSDSASGARNVVAVGTEDGMVQLLDVDRRMVARTVQISANLNAAIPIVMLTWIDQRKLIVVAQIARQATKVLQAHYESNVYILDTASCQLKDLRVGKKASHPIKCIRVSLRRQYAAIAFGKCVEIWDIAGCTQMKTSHFESAVSSVSWLPMKNFIDANADFFEKKTDTTFFSEQLLVSLVSESSQSITSNRGLLSSLLSASSSAGSSSSSTAGTTNLRCLTVAHKRVKSDQSDLDLGTNILSLASLGPFITSGDTTGTIKCWNAGDSSNRSFPTHKGPIKAMEMCVATSSKPGYLVFALFKSGEAVIWDATTGSRVASSGYLTQKGLKILSVGWLDDTPVVLTDDHCIRILDLVLSQSTTRVCEPTRISPQAHFSEEEKAATMAVLPHLKQMTVRTLLLNMGSKTFTQDHMNKLMQYVGEKKVKEFESYKDNTAKLALEVSKYLGNAASFRFWTLFASICEKNKRAPDNRISLSEFIQQRSKMNVRVPHSEAGHSTEATKSTGDPTPVATAAAGSANAEAAPKDATATSEKNDKSLLFAANFSMPTEMREMEGELLAVESRILEDPQQTTPTSELRAQLGASSIFVGRKEEAVNILINSNRAQTQSEEKTKLDYVSALKACVAAAAIDRDTFVTTTKMVAGQLIAKGELQEGAQLLCLIGKSADACKFMISQGKWTDAAWLANVSLGAVERDDIMSRWTSHLEEDKSVGRALEVALSMWDIHRVLNMLADARSWELGALVLRALDEAGYDLPTQVSDDSTADATGSDPEEIDTGEDLLRRGSGLLTRLNILCATICDQYKEHVTDVLHIPSLLP